MNKRELLDTMRMERARWDALLAQVDLNQMTEPALHDGWSVKDTIGHVAYYERWLLNWLEAAVRGKVTVATHRDLLDVDQRNAIIYKENKDRTIEDILGESHRVFERLFQLVQTLTEEDLMDAHRFERYVIPFWQKSEPLWQCIAGDSFEHYREHTPAIRDFSEQSRRAAGALLQSS